MDDQHLQYNADNFQGHCLPNQIWDPFQEKCIMHYCNSKFTLDEITCINQTHEGDQFYNPDPVPITPDVRLNFTVYVSTNGTNDKVDTITKKLLNNFGEKFSDALFIPEDRISNGTNGVRHATAADSHDQDREQTTATDGREADAGKRTYGAGGRTGS